MKTTSLYKIASVLLVLVAVANTYGLLSFWHVAAPMLARAFPDRSRGLFLRPSRSRLSSVLLYVCFVCSISCVASGWLGANDSACHRRIGMGSLHLPNNWSLHKLDFFFWACVAPYGSYCCLYRMGDLVGDSTSSDTARAE